MPRPPNYNFERKERERLKAQKKQEKLEKRAKAVEPEGGDKTEAESETEE